MVFDTIRGYLNIIQIHDLFQNACACHWIEYGALAYVISVSISLPKLASCYKPCGYKLDERILEFYMKV